jgi:ribosomal protein S18 acetylase RimI-like enzyme
MMTFELVPLDVYAETDAHLLTTMISLCAEEKDNLGYPLSEEVKTKLIQLFKENPHALAFAGYENGQAISVLMGFKMFSSWTGKTMFNVHDLVVLDAFRGQGYGSKTIQALEVWAKSEGIEQLTLEVTDDNLLATAFHHKNGFTKRYNYFAKNL